MYKPRPANPGNKYCATLPSSPFLPLGRAIKASIAADTVKAGVRRATRRQGNAMG